MLCCKNLSWDFSLNIVFFLLLWVMRVYIVLVKGMKVTLKNLQVKNFAGTLQDGLSHEVLAKYNLDLDFSASSNVLLTWPFRGNLYSQVSSELIVKLH